MIDIHFLISILSDGFFAAIAAIGFAVISNPPRKAILISALLAAIGHGLRFYLLKHVGLDLPTSSFIAAFSIGFFSIFFARLIHCPAEVFSFPSLLPMIPGMFAYKTILSLVQFSQCTDDNLSMKILVSIFRNGTTTVFILFALVVGVAIPMFIFYKQSYSMTRLLKLIKK
jgi:Uncharacterized conserved protein